VGEALLQLLERLDLPADLDPAREALQQRLESHPADADWSALLADLAELITGVRHKLQDEKRDIEQFLSQITDRLSALDTFLQGIDNDRSESLDSGRRLDQAVQEQVQGIHTSVREANDLDSLKQVVQQRLETIGKHMESFRETEEQRSAQAEKRIRDLNDRMHGLERETGELRDRIRQERRLALVDGLTGVPNRLAYEERITQEYARWKRFGEPLSVVIMDIDNFKLINDTYGHKAGDKVLKTIGQLLASKLRATDFLARYGGEEFLVLMPGADAVAATSVADKLREEVFTCGFHYRGDDVQISVSCGIAAFRPDEKPDDVFERADKAMYRAKEHGRNQCVTDVD
jgi:diguanylate cyclase